MRKVVFGTLTFALSVGACSLFGEDDDSIARISEEGVDGIHFGDNEEEVWDKFGKPQTTSSVDSDWPRSWKRLHYSTDEGTRSAFT